MSLFSNTVLSISFSAGSPSRKRIASVLSSTGLPSMASSSRIILARDANLMMFSSPPFFRLLRSFMRRSSSALSRASNMTLSASHASLTVSTAVTVLRCTGLTDIWMVASAAAFMASHASNTESDFLSSDEDAGRSVTTAAHSFSFFSCARWYAAYIL